MKTQEPVTTMSEQDLRTAVTTHLAYTMMTEYNNENSGGFAPNCFTALTESAAVERIAKLVIGGFRTLDEGVQEYREAFEQDLAESRRKFNERESR